MIWEYYQTKLPAYIGQPITTLYIHAVCYPASHKILENLDRKKDF
jgi:hypothetical protein